MQGWSQIPLKTINMGQDVFRHELPISITNPSPHVVRRVVDRKKSFLIHRGSAVQRYDFKNEQSEEEGRESGRSRGRNSQRLYIFKSIKNNPESRDKRQYMSIDTRNTKTTKTIGQKVNSWNPRLQKPRKSRVKTSKDHTAKIPVQSQLNSEQNRDEHRKISTVEQQVKRVDPYTKRQYTYIKNEERDQLKLIRKSKRARQFYDNHFCYSYRVATIELSPQKAKSKPLVYVPSTPKGKIIANVADPVTPRGVEGEGLMPPSPWDWGHISQQMGKDTIQ